MSAIPKFLDHDRGPDALDVLRIRAEARAMLVEFGELELADAVDALQEFAMTSGLVASLGQDTVQTIISNAFTLRSEAAADA
jgi:CobQ-like glutamine amidotransferase family enzyme